MSRDSRDDRQGELTPSDVARTAARILEDERGGPVRLIINGRHSKPTGRFQSFKNGRAMPWESRDERDLFILKEADAQVTSFLAQPHVLRMANGTAHALVYFPDCRVDYADGTVEIVEVKRAGMPLDPAYANKLDRARRIYAGIGWAHRITYGDEIRRRPAFDNASEICRSRFTHVSVDDAMSVTDLFRDPARPPTCGQAADALGGPPLGVARLHALIVRRVVGVRLSDRLDRATALHLPVTRRANFLA